MRKTRRFDVGGLSDEEGKLNVFNPTTNMERQIQLDYDKRRKEDQEAKAIRDKGGRGLGIEEEINTGDKTPARTNTYEYQGKAVAPTAPLPQAKRIITKEQMAAKGFTNLTDYLNDERKLKPRAGLKTTPSVSSDDYSKYYANQNKPAEAPKPVAAKKEEKEGGSALAFGIPAAAAAAAAVFGANKMAKKEEARVEADRAARDARSERDLASLKEAKNAPETAEARKIAKEGLDTKTKRGTAKAGGGGGGRYSRQMQLGSDFDPKALMMRDKKGGESGIEFKRGGKVKSASARADGCAIRGKTRA